MYSAFRSRLVAARVAISRRCLQYNAKAGRFFRVDRVDNGNGFENDLVDITDHVKFIADFENVEVGWILFQSGQAPDFRLVPIG